MRHEPPAPPEIPGFVHLDHIGRGGFAQVYLFEEQFPSRKVAVKVLDPNVSGHGGIDLEQFRAEANVMAQLSGHPSIVGIYGADVSRDRRPYILMEYCPPPSLGQRFRIEEIPVAEALDIGIRISSAVESAHRVGILHRDIKPPNILVSAFGVPKLTDFGIAGTAGDAAGTSGGVSIPWAAPEMFGDEDVQDVRTDVYSLAATVYTLLAGRAPFEVPGGANDNATLMHRARHQASYPRITRHDVPDRLQDALARGMALRPDDRPATALDFARSLQQVQELVGQAVTWTEIVQTERDGAVETEHVEQHTRIRPVSIIVPDVLAQHGTVLRPRSVPAGSPVLRAPDYPSASSVSDRTSVRRPRRRRKLAAARAREDDLAALDLELAAFRAPEPEPRRDDPVLVPQVQAALLLVAVVVFLLVGWFVIGGAAGGTGT